MKHLWIIYETFSVFNRDFSVTGFQIDPDLISGLLSALNYFSEIQLPNRAGIESINMGGLTFVYLIVKDYDLLFIAADEKDTSSNTLRSRLEVIRDSFIKKYDLTPEKWKAEFHGGKSDFEDFRRTVDVFVAQWKEAEKVISKAETFDLLGIFQQIYNICLNFVSTQDESIKILNDITSKIKNFITDIKNSNEFSDVPEISKINFDDYSWEIININPTRISPVLLEKILLILTIELRKLMIEKFGVIKFNTEINPFLLSNWGLIKKLQIDKKLLDIFLV
ncbi:MAG: hypothetical protein ACTSWY_11810 [Promethearchaeota archaeon]